MVSADWESFGQAAGTSERVRSGFPRADPDGLLDSGDEDLAIADSPGPGGRLDRLHGLVDELVGNDDFDLHLRQEIDDILGPAIELGIAFLPAEAFGLGHRNALEADFLQGFLHLVELEGFDDRLDLLHASSS